MAGTAEGGKKAAAKNLQRDPQFYAMIGRKGGQNGRTGGFAANPDLARVAGAKGGRISRRTKKIVTTDDPTAAQIANDTQIANAAQASTKNDVDLAA